MKKRQQGDVLWYVGRICEVDQARYAMKRKKRKAATHDAALALLDEASQALVQCLRDTMEGKTDAEA